MGGAHYVLYAFAPILRQPVDRSIYEMTAKRGYSLAHLRWMKFKIVVLEETSHFAFKETLIKFKTEFELCTYVLRKRINESCVNRLRTFISLKSWRCGKRHNKFDLNSDGVRGENANTCCARINMYSITKQTHDN